jgi:hypothetical protein
VREAQGRLREARELYVKVVQADPDHLDAWQKVSAYAWTTANAARENDDALFNMIRLDPLQRNTDPDFTDVTDLRGLWPAVQTMLKENVEKPESLYPLAASAAEAAKVKAQDEEKAEEAAGGAEDYNDEYDDDAHDRPTSPGEAVARSEVMRAIRYVVADE